MNTNDFSGDDHSRDNDDITVQIDEDVDHSELTARIERLAEENQVLRDENERLRSDDARTRGLRYRRLGLGLAILGTLAGLSVFAFPDAQNVLFAVAATGLFGGVLTYYLSHGDFLDARVCDRIYAAAATNGRALVDARDLRDERIYVPDEDGGTRLFVPKEADTEIPRVPTQSFVDAGHKRGAILEPTGEGLFREFERRDSGELADSPSQLATQLADAIVEQFELARGADPAVEHANGTRRVDVTITDSVLGDVDRFDHPIASFFAVGLAVGLQRPISLEITSRSDRSGWVATYTWNASDDAP